MLLQAPAVAQDVLSARDTGAEAAAQRVFQVSSAVLQKLEAGGPVDVLVLMDDSAEERAARTASGGVSPDRMNAQAYGRYVSEKARALRSLKSQVFSQAAVQDADLLTDYDVLPVAHVRVRNAAALERLANHPRVRSIDEVRENRMFLPQSLPLVQQPQAFSRGATGQGTSVCVLDTGTDYTRSAFGSCTAPGVPAGCKVAFAMDTAPNDHQRDADGHGTNVSATVLGVAPNARIIDMDVFEGAGAWDDDILTAINWCVANRATYNIAAINMSLGGGRYFSPVQPNDAFGVGLQNAVNAGIAVVVASGNESYTDSIAWPAAYSNVISVGAVYDSNIGPIYWSNCPDTQTAADRVTCFSNSASFLTMLAPGALIDAGGWPMGGTSQAAPHVAGAVAVLRQVHPNETVAQRTARLLAASQVTDHRNGIAKPRLNLIQSIDYGAAPTEPPLPTPQPGSARPSSGGWRHAIR